MNNTYIVRHNIPYCDMSPERHIVSLQNKNTRQAKNMIAIVIFLVTYNLPVIIFPVIMSVVCAGFATYAV
jgi:hypothetical protein